MPNWAGSGTLKMQVCPTQSTSRCITLYFYTCQMTTLCYTNFICVNKVKKKKFISAFKIRTRTTTRRVARWSFPWCSGRSSASASTPSASRSTSATSESGPSTRSTWRGTTRYVVQSWYYRWTLGCVNSRFASRGSQDAGVTQPNLKVLSHVSTVEFQSVYYCSRSRLECQSRNFWPASSRLHYKFAMQQFFFIFSKYRIYALRPRLGVMKTDHICEQALNPSLIIIHSPSWEPQRIDHVSEA